jgi:predicted DNA-binding antitoxin AbrB/MazE fold protein
MKPLGFIMSHVDAIYRGGVFEPLGPVNLCDEQRVQLSFKPANGQTVLAWLQHVKATQATILKREGVLPDSAEEIAADRRR